MKTFRAILTPKPGIVPGEDNIGLLTMELTYSIGKNARDQNPHSVIEHLLDDLHLTGLMQVEFGNPP
jgi:hypothetical protein